MAPHSTGEVIGAAHLIQQNISDIHQHIVLYILQWHGTVHIDITLHCAFSIIQISGEEKAFVGDFMKFMKSMQVSGEFSLIYSLSSVVK